MMKKVLAILAWTLVLPGLSPSLLSRQLAVQVVPEHPRLFFRVRPWGEGGLDVATLKRRAQAPQSTEFLGKLERSLPNLALRGLLMDDNGAVNQVVQTLTRDFEWKELTTDEGVDLAWRAMAFDWLFDRISEADRRIAAEKMIQGADILIGELRHGGHIFHTRMYGWGTGITLAGLALEGHHPEATRLWQYGLDYYTRNLLAARRLQGGAVHNGFGYGRKYTVWMTGHFLSCMRSATGLDLWAEIRDSQEDWVQRETLFTIYGRYPNGSYLRFGDSYSILSDVFSFRAVAERAAAYRDPVGQGFLLQLLSEAETSDSTPGQGRLRLVDNQTAYTYFLFFDPDLAARSPVTLPTKALFGRDGPGMVIWKSGWTPSDTTVFFKCGDYYGDHGHFDQGHLDVYRRAPLLIDSGSYLTFSGAFRMDYWRRTVAHNSVLVNDLVIQDEGGQRVFHSQSDATMEHYRANPLPETGNILDYWVKDGLAYVAGDYSKAYPPERVTRISREIAFLDDRFLVVVDRLELPDAELVPRVLWHCPVPPAFETGTRGFEIAREGARARVEVLMPADGEQRFVEGFQSAGKVIPAEGRLPPLSDMGVGRVETIGKPGKTEHLFVHLIDVADEGVPPVSSRAAFAASGLEVNAGGQRLIFRKDAPGLLQP